MAFCVLFFFYPASHSTIQGSAWALSSSIFGSWQVHLWSPLLRGTEITEAVQQVGWGTWAGGGVVLLPSSFLHPVHSFHLVLTPPTVFDFVCAASLFPRAIPSYNQDYFAGRDVKASPASPAAYKSISGCSLSPVLSQHFVLWWLFFFGGGVVFCFFLLFVWFQVNQILGGNVSNWCWLT